MLQNLAKIVFVVGLLMAGMANSFAQELSYKVGDAVEAFTNLTFEGKTGWVKAKIIGVDRNGQHSGGPYQVHFEGQSDIWSFWVRPDQVRSLAVQAAAVADQPVRNNPKPAVRAPGQFRVGDRVDVFYSDYAPPRPKGRGTVTEVGDGRYKVNYDGCKTFRDEWEDRMSVHSAATISTTDPEISFLTGNWAMFSPSYPNTVVHDGATYREYGMGAKAPPLQIKADGSYVWHFDFGKPPVIDRWTASPMVGERKVRGAANEGISHTVTDNGIVIKDPTGTKWKVYRWVSPGNQDRITAHLMCSGETIIGSRIQ